LDDIADRWAAEEKEKARHTPAKGEVKPIPVYLKTPKPTETGGKK